MASRIIYYFVRSVTETRGSLGGVWELEASTVMSIWIRGSVGRGFRNKDVAVTIFEANFDKIDSRFVDVQALDSNLADNGF